MLRAHLLDERVETLNHDGNIIRNHFGRGAARAEDVQGTPTQSHISQSILVYEDIPLKGVPTWRGRTHAAFFEKRSRSYLITMDQS